MFEKILNTSLSYSAVQLEKVVSVKQMSMKTLEKVVSVKQMSMKTWRQMVFLTFGKN